MQPCSSSICPSQSAVKENLARQVIIKITKLEQNSNFTQQLTTQLGANETPLSPWGPENLSQLIYEYK